MKSILISIKPKWVAKILNGDKTIEIRKTMPKCELPCKVYIYCTKEKSYLDRLVQNHNGFYYTVRELVDFDANEYGTYYDIAGKNGEVVAEFTLNRISTIEICDPDILVNGKIASQPNLEQSSRLTINDIMSYIGYGDDHDGWGNKEWSVGYAWHIDNLKIYDEPKELSEFTRMISEPFESWHYNHREKLKRPPQSWCYVEDNGDVKN